MYYLLKLLFHSAILTLYIYVFFIASQFVGTSWINWLWSIITGLLIIVNYAIIFVGIKDNAYPGSDKYDEMGRQIMVALIFFEAISICSITFKMHESNIESEGISILPILLFFLFSGIRRYTFSYIYAVSSIIFIATNIDLSLWHGITLLVCSILAHIFVIFSLGNELGTEEDLKLDRIGLFICPAIIGYAYLFGEFPQQDSFQIVGTLVYILLCLIVSISDNNIVYAISPTVVLGYGIFLMLEWHPIYSWVMIIISVIFTMLFLYWYIMYKKHMNGLAVHLISMVKNIGDRYNNLVKDYNNLVKGGSGKISHGSSSRSNPVGDGFLKGVGRELARLLFS